MKTLEEIYKRLKTQLTPEAVYILCVIMLQQNYDDEALERILSGEFER